MTILVTGGAGFIGSRAIEFLLSQTNDRVVCLDNFHSYYDPSLKRANVATLFDEPRVAMIQGDFRDADLVEQVFSEHEVDEVLHLGGMAGVRHSVDSPREYFSINVDGTLELLEACRRHDVRRFVLASSSTVYGRGARAPFVEDAPLGAPMSPYGASKRAAETLCETFHALHGVPTVRVRLFSVYGPRLRPDLALRIFAERMLAGQPLTVYGDGSVRRDFTHVDDICRGLWAALRAPGIEGEAFNLGASEPIVLRDVIAGLEHALGRRAIVHRRDARDEDLPLTHADLTKSRQLLGYRPEIEFPVGLADFCDWLARTTPRATTRRAA